MTTIPNLPLASQILTGDAIPIAQSDGVTRQFRAGSPNGFAITDSSGYVSGLNAIPIGGTTARSLGARFADIVNVLDWGVSSSNSDNIIQLQAAANYAANNGKLLYIPAAPFGLSYKYTPPLLITKNISIIGDFLAMNTGSYAFGTNFNTINYPSGTPPFLGSVLSPVSNGQDAILVTAPVASLSINIQNIGIIFQTQFVGTGHAFNYIPPYNAGTTEYDGGLTDARFYNFYVWGHDGNHYAINLINEIQNTFIDIRSYGGGIFNSSNQSKIGNWGNTTLFHPYGCLMVRGTANGYNLTSTGGVTYGRLQKVTMIKPQCNAIPYTGPSPPTAPNNSQYMFYADTYAYDICLIAQDFETSTGSLVQFPGPVNGLNSSTVDWTSGTETGVLYANPLVSSSRFPDGTLFKMGTFATSGATSGTFNFPTPFALGGFGVTLQGIGTGSQPLLSAVPTNAAFSWTAPATITNITYIAYGYG